MKMKILAVACAAAALLATNVNADDAALQKKIEQMQQQLDQQSRQLAEMRSQGEANWLDERRAEEIKSLVRDVLADADSRASMLEGGMTAGWDGGFFLASADGNFKMNLIGKVQFQYILGYQENAPAAGDKDIQSGFQLRRVEFGFKGHVVDPTWQYMIYIYRGNTGGATLLDAWIRKDLGDGMAVRAGQFKLPVWKEWLLSSSRQQMVDRSLISGVFAGSYTQGVMFEYTQDQYRLFGSLNDGIGTINSAWNTSTVEGIAGTARVEYKFAGNWKQAADFQAWLGEDMLILVGGSVHYEHNAQTATNNDEGNVVRWSVDGHLENEGFGLFVAVLGNHVFDSNTSNVDQFGVIVQGGYFVMEDLEAFARYEFGDLDSATQKDLHLITVGVNKFFNGHRVKWTTDVGFSINEVTSGWASTAAGWRTDAAGEENQVVFRSQLQLMF